MSVPSACCMARLSHQPTTAATPFPEDPIPLTTFPSTVLRLSRTSYSPFPNPDQEKVIVLTTIYEMDTIRALETYCNRVSPKAAQGDVQVCTLARWTVLPCSPRNW